MLTKIAIVILNWNGESFLKKYLPTLYQNSDLPDTKIWVIDNGSTDGSISWIEKEFPQTGLIKLDKNYGFTGGYNLGLKKIAAQYYVLLNSDVEVTQNWLKAPISILENNADIAVVAPKILSVAKPKMFEYAGAAGGFIDYLGFPFCRGRILTTLEEDNNQYDSSIPIFWASGACMFIKSRLFHDVGGFDDNFFAHMEEIDLCWRLKNLGYKIYFTPESVVYHVGGGTLPNENPLKIYLNYRNNLLLLYKNLPRKKWIKIFLIRIFYDSGACGIFILQRKFNFAKSVIKAYRDFFRMRNQYNSLLWRKNISLPKEILRNSIVFQYFIFGKRRFSELRLK